MKRREITANNIRRVCPHAATSL